MQQLKAKFFLALIAITWGSLIILMLPLLLVAFIYDKQREGIKWLYSILLAQDHLVNAIMGGHFLTTISSMLGHLRLEGSSTGKVAADVVDWLFERAIGQNNHCTVAMEDSDVYQFSARRAIAGSACYYISLYFVINAIINTYF
jgi:hypothetical protein